jgi:hypothetical protein
VLAAAEADKAAAIERLNAEALAAAAEVEARLKGAHAAELETALREQREALEREHDDALRIVTAELTRASPMTPHASFRMTHEELVTPNTYSEYRSNEKKDHKREKRRKTKKKLAREPATTTASNVAEGERTPARRETLAAHRVDASEIRAADSEIEEEEAERVAREALEIQQEELEAADAAAAEAEEIALQVLAAAEMERIAGEERLAKERAQREAEHEAAAEEKAALEAAAAAKTEAEHKAAEEAKSLEKIRDQAKTAAVEGRAKIHDIEERVQLFEKLVTKKDDDMKRMKDALEEARGAAVVAAEAAKKLESARDAAEAEADDLRVRLKNGEAGAAKYADTLTKELDSIRVAATSAAEEGGKRVRDVNERVKELMTMMEEKDKDVRNMQEQLDEARAVAAAAAEEAKKLEIVREQAESAAVEGRARISSLSERVDALQAKAEEKDVALRSVLEELAKARDASEKARDAEQQREAAVEAAEEATERLMANKRELEEIREEAATARKEGTAQIRAQEEELERRREEEILAAKALEAAAIELEKIKSDANSAAENVGARIRALQDEVEILRERASESEAAKNKLRDTEDELEKAKLDAGPDTRRAEAVMASPTPAVTPPSARPRWRDAASLVATSPYRWPSANASSSHTAPARPSFASTNNTPVAVAPSRFSAPAAFRWPDANDIAHSQGRAEAPSPAPEQVAAPEQVLTPGTTLKIVASLTSRLSRSRR